MSGAPARLPSHTVRPGAHGSGRGYGARSCVACCRASPSVRPAPITATAAPPPNPSTARAWRRALGVPGSANWQLNKKIPCLARVREPESRLGKIRSLPTIRQQKKPPQVLEWTRENGRVYDKRTSGGSFLSIDPVTTDANTGSSFNRYNYTNNNPYKYTDPDGRQAKEPSDLCAGQSRMNCGTLGTITVSSDPGTKKGAAAGSAGASSPGSSPSNTGYEQGGAYEMNIMGDPMSTSAPYVGGMQVVAGTTLVVGTGAVIVTGGAAATGTVQVTSWAPAGVVPDLAAGRWVMMGGPTLSNYIRTFLWGPKYVPGIGFVGATSPFANSVTGNVAAVSVRLPPSWEVWKAAFGQRFLK